MAFCAPMLGSNEMEMFAEKQLAIRLPELVQSYRAAPVIVQAEVANDYKILLTAAAKFKKNKDDCPLPAGGLLRHSVDLKNRIAAKKRALEEGPAVAPKKVRLDPSFNPLIKRTPQPAAEVDSDPDSDSATQRRMPIGCRGPHPIVKTALRKRDDKEALRKVELMKDILPLPAKKKEDQKEAGGSSSTDSSDNETDTDSSTDSSSSSSSSSSGEENDEAEEKTT
ncbi:hypothetical protein DIPPA_13784 [Diplonema papillatum]|nr:hypothetical protein DIPPA_13784 [Diplonema papillatum]